MSLTKRNGEYLLDISKKAIEKYLETKEKLEVPINCPEELKEKLGVFVTLNMNNQLRGCIGYAEPVLPVIEATINGAVQAAFNDPRFNPLTLEEFKLIEIEVTVLTKPQLLKVNHPNEYVKKIRIGTDGLIVEKGFNKGLLLPQVATEYNMSAEEFISHTCLKANLRENCYLKGDCDVYTFQGQIFKER